MIQGANCGNTELSSRRDLCKVKGEDNYLYRALDSISQTIDFPLSAKRDAAAAKRFLHRAIEASGNPMPRVINVDKNPVYPAAIAVRTHAPHFPESESTKLPH